MSDLASLKSSLRSRVHTIEVLLGTKTPPVQNLTQEFEYDGYIKRINDMTLKAANFLDIEANHGDDIEATELDAFRTSLNLIEHRISIANAALCKWKASKIEKIINMLNKAKANNQPYDNTMVPGKAFITENEPSTTASLSQTPPSSCCASRFPSWTHLCLGTSRRYPNPDDIFQSSNYARKPKCFNQEPGAKTNPECRICKILESTGKH